MTFAAIFPERVDRMMLDAVVNPHEHMAGTSLEMLLDADKAYDAFLNECIEAPLQCELAAMGVNAEALSIKVNTMLQDVIARDNGAQLYRVIKNDILYRSLYWPSSWTELASQLSRFIGEDFASLEADANTSFAAFEYNKGSAAIFGTRCADSSLRARYADDLSDLIYDQQTVSSFADVNLATSIVCAAWKIEAAERYEGNFTARTARPILFVNGLYDPAAPIASAYNASSGFEGSVVLAHESYGVGQRPRSQELTDVNSMVSVLNPIYVSDGLSDATF